MDELQPHTNPSFYSFDFEDEGYSSSNSCLAPLKEFLSSHVEAKSFYIVIMPIMVTEAVNFEEQLASMKAPLNILSKKSAEKDTQIKRQNEHKEAREEVIWNFQ